MMENGSCVEKGGEIWKIGGEEMGASGAGK